MGSADTDLEPRARRTLAAARANYEIVAHTAIIAVGVDLAWLTAAEGDLDRARELTTGWVRDVMPHVPGVLLFAAANRAAPR